MAKGKKGGQPKGAAKSSAKKADAKGPAAAEAPADKPGRVPAEQSKPATEDQKALAVGDADAMTRRAEGSFERRGTLHSIDFSQDPPTLSFEGKQGSQLGGAVEVPSGVELTLNGREPALGLEDLRRGDELVVVGDPVEKIEATRKG
jgi:hypothetical protein